MKTTRPSISVALEANSPRIIALLILMVMALLALTGCKSGDRAATEIDPTGVYKLVSVDGKRLPCNLTHEQTVMIIKSGAFAINTDGTCRSQMTFSVPPNADMHREVKATYTRNGADLAMKWEHAGTTKGVVQGNNFTMTNEGMVLSYQK